MTATKISLSLKSPHTTPLHRAGLAGLYMTLKELENQFPAVENRPHHFCWQLKADEIALAWEGNDDFTVLDWLFRQSFQIDHEGLIDLRGWGNYHPGFLNRFHQDQVIKATFLRHNSTYTKGKTPKEKKILLPPYQVAVSYRPLQTYRHQAFAEELCDSNREKRDYIPIVSWLYLGGVLQHARLPKTKLEESFGLALMLLFAPVACGYFLCHQYQEEMQLKEPSEYLVVVPEVANLETAANRRWELETLDAEKFHVASSEEATLTYYFNETFRNNQPLKPCQVFSYHKFQSSSQQNSLIDIQEVEIDGQTLSQYQLICQFFPTNKIVKFPKTKFQKKKSKLNNELKPFNFDFSNSIVSVSGSLFNNEKNIVKTKSNPLLPLYIPAKIQIKTNFIRGIIARNIVNGNHWWSNLLKQCYQIDPLNGLSEQLVFNQGGLRQMFSQGVGPEDHLNYVDLFHEALKKSYARIYQSYQGEDLNSIKTRVQKERERIRAELNRCYNKRSLQFFLANFLQKANLTQSNDQLQQNWQSFFRLLQEKPWEEIRIWSILALASYVPQSQQELDDDTAS